jgi:beta-lactam-binding protein with PASTA domain
MVAVRKILDSHCTFKLTQAYSKKIKLGRVISQHPKPGTKLANGGQLRIVVSKGRPPSHFRGW